MSCSRTRCSAAVEAWTRNPSILSQALYTPDYRCRLFYKYHSKKWHLNIHNCCDQRNKDYVYPSEFRTGHSICIKMHDLIYFSIGNVTMSFLWLSNYLKSRWHDNNMFFYHNQRTGHSSSVFKWEERRPFNHFRIQYWSKTQKWLNNLAFKIYIVSCDKQCRHRSDCSRTCASTVCP